MGWAIRVPFNRPLWRPRVHSRGGPAITTPPALLPWNCGSARMHTFAPYEQIGQVGATRVNVGAAGHAAKRPLPP
eukprot:4082170-Alexandrium_andersonii.AAC.1